MVAMWERSFVILIFLPLSVLTFSSHSWHSPRSYYKLSASSRDSDDSSSSIAGVSVSPTGFWVFLGNEDEDELFPLQITTTPSDSTAATSPEALTILQLLAGVDMAGAVLPPEALSRLVEAPLGASTLTNVTLVSNADDNDDDFPSSFELTYAISNRDRTTVSLTKVPATLPRGSASLAFYAIALALRYRVPVSHQSAAKTTMGALRQQFPAYQSTRKAVLEPAQASAAQLEKGFEINKLQAALNMARAKGDDLAAAKIRARIDAMDAKSLEQLPVQAESDTSSMQ